MKVTDKRRLNTGKGRPKLYQNRDEQGEAICSLCSKSMGVKPSRHMKYLHPEEFYKNNPKKAKKRSNILHNSESSPEILVPGEEQTDVMPSLDNNGGLSGNIVLEYAPEGLEFDPENCIELDFEPFPLLENVPSLCVKTPAPVKLYDPYPKNYDTAIFDNSEANSFDVPIFEPSKDDMNKYSLIDYVTEVVENQEKAHLKSGICKIIPPEGYLARDDGHGMLNSEEIIPKFQTFSYVGKDLYKLEQSEYKPMKVSEYKELNEERVPCPPVTIKKENLFWDESRLLLQRGFYGTDSERSESLFVKPVWNISNLSSILKFAERQFKNQPIPGLTTPFLYYGGWGSAFPLHVEDMNSYSVNYLHDGESKVWYTTQQQDDNKQDFHTLLRRLYDVEYTKSKCPTVYRHKQLFPCPRILQNNKTKVGRVEQRKGEFIVTFPGGFHWGYNSGFNVAEAINFGTDRWMMGALAKLDLCPPKCTYKSPRWNMKLFQKHRLTEETGTKCANHGAYLGKKKNMRKL